MDHNQPGIKHWNMQFACFFIDDWPSMISITSLCIGGDFNGWVGCNGETALIAEPFPGSISLERNLDCSVDISTIITANEMHNRSGRWDNIVCWGAAGGKLNRALLGVLVSGYSIAPKPQGPCPTICHDSLSLFRSLAPQTWSCTCSAHMQSMFHWSLLLKRIWQI